MKQAFSDTQLSHCGRPGGSGITSQTDLSAAETDLDVILVSFVKPLLRMHLFLSTVLISSAAVFLYQMLQAPHAADTPLPTI